MAGRAGFSQPYPHGYTFLRIYEINARFHCDKFEKISNAELKSLKELGFDAIWLMGIWQISRAARRISRLVAPDFEGSPYAVPDYKFSNQLGGKAQFAALFRRAHDAGLRVFVDFVSNHTSIDSPWIDTNPEFFITGDLNARIQTTAEYFYHPSGKMVAFGRDPFFPPWHDTAQLDYTNSKLRSKMIDVLKRIARYADGVRCDMAMLVLRDYIRRQWYPLIDQASFDERMPGEFWDDAISEIKQLRPDFTFIAEAYWDKEQRLIDLGFDLAYEKKLYDALAARNADQVKMRIQRSPEELRRSLCFIENHDEPRAAQVFTKSGSLASAALIMSLPVSVLIHEGQMEGMTEKLPVQRIRPLEPVVVDEELRRSYYDLLRVTADPLFSQGDFTPFETGVYGMVSFVRKSGGRVVAYLGQIADAWHTFESVELNVAELARIVNADSRLRLTNLFTNDTTMIESAGGVFKTWLKDVGVKSGTAFCLIEASAA